MEKCFALGGGTAGQGPFQKKEQPAQASKPVVKADKVEKLKSITCFKCKKIGHYSNKCVEKVLMVAELQEEGKEYLHLMELFKDKCKDRYYIPGVWGEGKLIHYAIYNSGSSLQSYAYWTFSKS